MIDFLQFINKTEDNFNKQFNDNKEKTLKAVETLGELIIKFTGDYKKAMEVKFNKYKNYNLYNQKSI